MMQATKIKMNSGYHNSTKCQDIDSIYLTGAKEEKFYPKGVLHDFLKTSPKSIKVNLSPYPFLVHATSPKGEKYVRSEADDTLNDNLLRLPRV